MRLFKLTHYSDSGHVYVWIWRWSTAVQARQLVRLDAELGLISWQEACAVQKAMDYTEQQRALQETQA